MSIVGNDLASCYDRISHLVAAMAYRAAGAARSVVEMRFKTVQQIKIHVRTTHGDSAMTDQDLTTDTQKCQPPHGILQGAPDGPVCWALVSSAITEAMRAEGYGATIPAPISDEEVKLLGCQFVDDSTYTQTSATIEGLLLDTTRAQTLLSGLVRATGGALEPTKSFMWVLDHRYTGQEYQLKTAQQVPFSLQVPDDKGEPTTIPQLEVTDTRRMLGVELGPVSGDKAQTAVLRKKGQEWADRLKNKKLNPRLAWTGLTTGIMKGMAWPLAACTLSEGQCSSAMAPVLRAGLRASGIVSTMPRCIVHGPKGAAGLGLPSLFDEMGAARLEQLANFGGETGLTGRLRRATYQYLQLEAGLPGHIFKHSHQKWKPVLTRTWISETWAYASARGITVRPGGEGLKSRRAGDRFIMAGLREGEFGPKELRAINRVRKYLKATTVADISSQDGKRLLQAALDGTRMEQLPHNPYKWPKQEKPRRADWNIWRRAIAPLTRLGSPTCLVTSLGEWQDD